jgi:hypothetical protein
MNKWMITAAIATALPVASTAQVTGSAFQNVVTLSGQAGPVTVNYVGNMKSKVVTGRPLTASEEHHTLQVLGDGTRIESKSTDKFYRDDQGRTRTEREDGTVLIDDPVSGASAEMNGNKTLMRRNYDKQILDSKMATEARTVTLPAVKTGYAYTFTTDDAVITSDEAVRADKLKAEKLAKAKVSEASNQEDLGFQMVNGTSAQGTRTTTSIPLGQIGNDRPISVVSERWYSPDLQMLIRSSNKDPRFGETTYELTNILQGPPDPSLFQIPSK